MQKYEKNSNIARANGAARVPCDARGRLVSLFDNVVNPDTFKDDSKVALFDNVDHPDVFNDYTIVTLLFNVVNPDIFNDDHCNSNNK